MRAFRIAAVLLLLSWPSWAPAQDPAPEPETVTTWTVEPAQPSTRSFVRLRMHVTGCVLLTSWYWTVDQTAREIRAYIAGSDVCDYGEEIHFLPVGYLPAGAWRVIFFGCDGADPTQCSPSQRPNLLFGVTEAGPPSPATIPAWSTLAAFGLAGVLGGVAWLRLRRH